MRLLRLSGSNDAVIQWLTRPQDEPKTDNWTRVIYGAVVQFGDGAAVVKTSLQSDFSAVRLTGLPLGSSPTSVSALLDRLAFSVSHTCIRLPPPRQDAVNCVADVRVEDPSFAQRLCASIVKPGPSPAESLAGITAVQINAPMPGGLNAHRVECKKVHISWYHPFRTVWLNFSKRWQAQQVNDKFNAGQYTVLAQPVKSSGPSESGRNYRNTLPFTITLTDVPGRATASDVVRTLPTFIRPGHVELGKPSYACDPGTANTIVKAKLAEIGPLEWWEEPAGVGGKRAKAKARFQDEGDAARAAAVLNASKLPFHDKGNLTVQAIFSARFKVPDRIYQAVQEQVAAQSRVWFAKHVFFTAYEPSRAYRVLKLEGEDSNAIAETKQALEEILAGTLARLGDDILWAPSFGLNGDIARQLKAIEQKLGIVIVRNKRRSRLQLYGQPEQCAKAQKLLAGLVEEDSSTTNVIELDEDKFAWACSGGFRELVKAFGRKVEFDIISTPKRILVGGSEKDARVAHDMVASQKQAAGLAVASMGDCAICWTEAENPIQTRCGHAYCSDCFERFCFSDNSATDSFKIRCEGNSGNCKTILSLDELQEHLPSSTFDEMLETSFKFHISRHPEAFHYCPKAGCGQIYRVSSSGVVFRCPGCLTALCTTCHVSHEGKSCAEHKYLNSEQYAAWEKTKQKLGIKECPKCKTAIEKLYGCDHMTCGGCGTHICWNCLAIFDTDRECYSHMSKAHGPHGERVHF